MIKFDNRIEMTHAQFEALRQRINDLYGAALQAKLSNPLPKKCRKNRLPQPAI